MSAKCAVDKKDTKVDVYTSTCATIPDTCYIVLLGCLVQTVSYKKESERAGEDAAHAHRGTSKP